MYSYFPWAVNVLVFLPSCASHGGNNRKYLWWRHLSTRKSWRIFFIPICKEYLPISHNYHLDSCNCSGSFIFSWSQRLNKIISNNEEGNLVLNVVSYASYYFLLLSKFPGKGVVNEFSNVRESARLHVFMCAGFQSSCGSSTYARLARLVRLVPSCRAPWNMFLANKLMSVVIPSSIS